MSNPLPPLHVQAEVSRLLQGFLLSTHSLSGLIILFLPHTAGWVKTLLLLLVLASLQYYWRLHIQRKAKRSVLSLSLYEPNTARLYTSQGAQFVSLDDSSFISAYCMVLNWRTQANKLHTLILFRDSIAPSLWRELYIRLRFA